MRAANPRQAESWPGGRATGPAQLLRVVAGTEPVHDLHRSVPDAPGVVSLRQHGHVAWPGVKLRAVCHDHVQHPGNVILEMRCFAEICTGQWLDVIGPAPARLQQEHADLAAAYLQQLKLAALEAAGLIRSLEALVLCR